MMQKVSHGHEYPGELEKKCDPLLSAEVVVSLSSWRRVLNGAVCSLMVAGAACCR